MPKKLLTIRPHPFPSLLSPPFQLSSPFLLISIPNLSPIPALTIPPSPPSPPPQAQPRGHAGQGRQLPVVAIGEPFEGGGQVIRLRRGAAVAAGGVGAGGPEERSAVRGVGAMGC